MVNITNSIYSFKHVRPDIIQSSTQPLYTAFCKTNTKLRDSPTKENCVKIDAVVFEIGS